MRMYDARVGGFFSVDPLTGKYPELSPYQFASNRPIDGIDRDGLEGFYMPAIRDKNGNVDKKATMELLQTEADAGKGLAESGKGTVVGLWNIGGHPVNTVKNLWRAGTHLTATAKAIKKQTVKEFRENPAEARGKLTGYIAQLLVGGEIANGLSKAGKVSRVVKAEDVAADAVTLPKLGIKYFDEITDISRVTANQLVSVI